MSDMLTDLSFLDIGQPWPPACERERLDTYRKNKDLWSGEHQRVFNDWVRLLRQDNLAALEMIFNAFKRLSTVWADLLLGEPPAFIAGEEDSDIQKRVERLILETMFVMTAYEVVLDISRYGDGLFKVTLENGKARIDGQPPSMWFPVVSLNNLKQVQYHVLAWTFDVETQGVIGKKITTYLRTEIHSKGSIENRLYRLEDGKIKAAVPLAEFFPDVQEVEETRIDGFLVIPVVGLRTTDCYYGMDDYSDLITIIQEIEVRVAQISRILDKHADPSMYGPADAVRINPTTGDAEFVGGGSYYPTEDGENIPGYITWDGQIDAAFQEIDALMKQFYIVSETSPAAFGQMDAGLVTSGSALRRLMMAPLAKVNRVRLRLEPALREVIETALELEGAASGTQVALEDITIRWRDGLPEDPQEMTTIEVARKGAGLTSTYSALRRLDNSTEAETQEEIDRIDEEEASSAGAMGGLPNLRLRFGGPNDGTQGDQGQASQTGLPDNAGGNAGNPGQTAGAGAQGPAR